MSALVALATLALKSLLLSSFVLMALWLLRRRPAAEQCLVASLGLLFLVALPAISALVPTVSVEAPHWSRDFVVRAELPRASLQGIDLAAWSIYLLPGLFLLCSLVVGLLQLSYYRQLGAPVQDSRWLVALEYATRGNRMRRRMRLSSSAEVSSPMSWGLLQPIVVIDRATLEQPQNAAAILAHEVAHIARFDWCMLIVGRLAIAVFWFNPLVWLLSRRSMLLAEQAADNRVLSSGVVSPIDYARILLSLAARTRTAPTGFGNCVGSSRSELSLRVVAALQTHNAPRRVHSVVGAAALTAAAVLNIALGSIQLHATPRLEEIQHALATLREVVAAKQQLRDTMRVEFMTANRTPPERGGSVTRRQVAAPPDGFFLLRWQERDTQVALTLQRLRRILSRAEAPPT